MRELLACVRAAECDEATFEACGEPSDAETACAVPEAAFTRIELAIEQTCGPDAGSGFFCDDGTWIDGSALCDGVDDCNRGEDEILCSEVPTRFTPQET